MLARIVAAADSDDNVLFVTLYVIGEPVCAAGIRIAPVNGAALIPGASAPKLVPREMLRRMKKGGDGGRRHRPGRMLRNLARHDP